MCFQLRVSTIFVFLLTAFSSSLVKAQSAIPVPNNTVPYSIVLDFVNGSIPRNTCATDLQFIQSKIYSTYVAEVVNETWITNETVVDISLGNSSGSNRQLKTVCRASICKDVPLVIKLNGCTLVCGLRRLNEEIHDFKTNVRGALDKPEPHQRDLLFFSSFFSSPSSTPTTSTTPKTTTTSTSLLGTLISWWMPTASSSSSSSSSSSRSSSSQFFCLGVLCYNFAAFNFLNPWAAFSYNFNVSNPWQGWKGNYQPERAEMSAKVFYQYVDQYASPACKPILNSMTYIIVDYDIQV